MGQTNQYTVRVNPITNSRYKLRGPKSGNPHPKGNLPARKRKEEEPGSQLVARQRKQRSLPKNIEGFEGLRAKVKRNSHSQWRTWRSSSAQDFEFHRIYNKICEEK